MASGTALTPAIIATWPVPNYVDPVSQREAVEAAIYATTIPMVCLVASRIYVRANQKSGVGADDWIMVGAAVFAVAISVCLLVTTTNSLGRHLYDVNPLTFVSSAKYNVASVTMYNASMTLTKLSTWVASRVTMALCIEYNVGIMSGCLPCLRPFLAMMAPGIFAGPSAARSGNAASSGGASWRKSPFRFGNSNLFKLGAGKPSEHGEDYEFADAEHAGAARAWAAGGKGVPQASIGIVSGPDISVNRDAKLRDGYDSPGIVTNDATSEEWIMKEDSSR
ncbi:hypothetical protein BKA58DRAFT_348647 [Alternaria rosae]|uniref:uncharacterized protein n=1 Tax=Alternaria rosae TaxID=1187941 RepID=UPI001E8ED4B9|nr:uncharacterized protein BKA58DRAFT_348647 [Alternaria rosae]KAH6851462.1 hypothetical protein BKA58DRAFT_348647 [Alternaria rosae]